jgi:hypothetical protein
MDLFDPAPIGETFDRENRGGTTMNESNFVKRMNWLATGDTFLAERQLSIADIRLVTTGLDVGNATDPTLEINGIQFDDTDTAHILIQIPQDYAAAADLLALRIKLTPTGANNTTNFGITTAQSFWRDGDAVDATASDAVTEGLQAAAATTREVFLSLSGRGFEPGDTVLLTFVAVCTGTDELMVHNVSLVYGSCFAAYDNADRHRDIS